MKKLRFLSYLLSAALISMLATSCELLEEDPNAEDDDKKSEYPIDTGLDFEEEKKHFSSIPKDLSLITLSNSNVTLASAVSLTDYVPPVGNQGQYGTCTAWATGYYARTIMYARENKLSKADLNNNSNVFSPLDIFLAMNRPNCNGSAPSIAFQTMQTRGIATLATAPYENLGNCNWAPKAAWTSEAAKYKIENFRTVDPTNVNAVKSYIQLGRPVQVSCLLGRGFHAIKNSDVHYSDDYSNEVEHGRHAMVVVGYDDNKGENGAFLIVNSWGAWWGDKGYCWVDYKFFSEKFCFYAYVIEGDKGGLSEAMLDQKVINPNYQVDGKDLMTVQLTDVYDAEEGESQRDRVLTYNVFNRGKQSVNSSDKWNILYYYYNAFNPEKDFGIIIYDSYTNAVGKLGESGDFEDLTSNVPEKFGMHNWWNNVNVPAGYSVAKAVMGDGADYDFMFYYSLPETLTGEYYFVLYADGFNAIEEQFEQNNFMFFTGKDRKPLQITKGVIDASQLKSGGKISSNAAELKEGEPNAYTLDEIAGLIKYQKKTGILEDRLEQHLKSASQASQTPGRGKRVVPARLPREM